MFFPSRYCVEDGCLLSHRLLKNHLFLLKNDLRHAQDNHFFFLTRKNLRSFHWTRTCKNENAELVK